MRLKTEDLFRLESYDYFLPNDRIAQYPVAPRDSSQLLLVSRKNETLADHRFADLPDLLQEGDLLVVNDTRVIPARLQCSRGEVLLIAQSENRCWNAMVYPGKNFKPGDILEFEGGMRAEVLSQSPLGRMLHFQGNVEELIRNSGKMPLPPYIERKPEKSDRKAYQTLFAKRPGSVAAPTAGLHFSRRVFQALHKKGIEIVSITLHVGPGTFKPVKSADITHHVIYPEYYKCKDASWKKIREASRVIAVGTTTTRALETIATNGQTEGYTGLYIFPGYEFKIIRGLLTNFHLPKSSLLMLVSAFGNYRLVRRAYQHAIDHGYRFYSYGDAMLLL